MPSPVTPPQQGQVMKFERQTFRQSVFSVTQYKRPKTTSRNLAVKDARAAYT